MSDKIAVSSFHHIEFYCGDATSYSRRFMGSLGVDLMSKTDHSTGNSKYASYLMQSGDMKMVFTAPYKFDDSAESSNGINDATLPFPGYSSKYAADFFSAHGFAARAVAVTVENVQVAYDTMVKNGGQSVLPPTIVQDKNKQGSCFIAEVKLYGDVVLRLLDTADFSGAFLPNFVDVKASTSTVGKYGIARFDHIVGNVWSLKDTLTYVKNMTVSLIYSKGLYILLEWCSLVLTIPIHIGIGFPRIC